jgi:hypothetical protein
MRVDFIFESIIKYYGVKPGKYGIDGALHYRIYIQTDTVFLMHLSDIVPFVGNSFTVLFTCNQCQLPLCNSINTFGSRLEDLSAWRHPQTVIREVCKCRGMLIGSRRNHLPSNLFYFFDSVKKLRKDAKSV